jgi:hypothetical protein
MEPWYLSFILFGILCVIGIAGSIDYVLRRESREEKKK